MTSHGHITESFDSSEVFGESAYGRLVSIVNSEGLVLDGVVFSPPEPCLAVIHVHGSLGNFYQQQFIRVFANRLARERVALLSFNLTCHDGISEGYNQTADMKYIGGSLSKFETCLEDLDALLHFAKSLCPKVVFQGHSLGCDRVLFYTQNRSSCIPMILLSPCDSYRLQEKWLDRVRDRESVSEQAARLSSGSALERGVHLLQESEYGLNGPDGWTYRIPISRAALLSILQGPPFQILRVDPTAQCLSCAPTFVYMGDDDKIRGVSLDDMEAHVRRLVPSSEICIRPGGDHSLTGCEEAVAEEILAWAHKGGLLCSSAEPPV